MLRLSLVVPVYNESAAVDKVAAGLKEAVRSFPFEMEILFVDDGSTDDTSARLERSGFTPIRHEKNKGYGAAIKTGARAARGEWIALMDCDGTYDPNDLPRLLERSEGCGMVVGLRPIELNPRLHIFTKRLSTSILSRMFNCEVGDINSGLRIIRRDLFLAHEGALCEGFSLTSSITYFFLLAGFKIVYVPISYKIRIGRSKLKRIPFLIRFFKALATARSYYLNRFSVE